MQLSELHLWRDPVFRDAASNMALDEALFEWSIANGLALARFYHWDRPSVTVGYFQKSREAGGVQGQDAPVRRYTGGGLVEHGEDLTFVLTLPPKSEAARAPSGIRYQWIHEALASALAPFGFPVGLERNDAPAVPGPCFTTPVPWDLLDPANGRKLGGGAQRRTRGAVIHQGSLRLPGDLRSPDAGWIERFGERLSPTVRPFPESAKEETLAKAAGLKRAKYACPHWNERL